MTPLADGERAFVQAAIRRRRLFLALAALGVVAAVGLGAFYAYRRWTDAGYPVGARVALVVLVLLNARQNLRQYRYAGALAKLVGTDRG